MNSDRQLPPQSIEAEMSILGGILVENGAIGCVLEILTPEDLYRESHRKILRAMMELDDRGEPCDLITLTDVLRKRGELEEVGGGAYLAVLVDFVPMAANIAYYCRIVVQKAQARRIIANAQDAIRIIYDGGEMAEAQAKLEAAALPGGPASGAPVGMEQSVAEAHKRIQRRHESKGQLQGTPYGIDDLDRATSGMHPGELIIIAGRPSMGKSAFAGNVATNVCSAGGAGLLFTLEMARGDVVDRLAASFGVRYENIRSGQMQEAEWPKLLKAMERMHAWRLSIDDTPAISLRNIRAKARRQKKDGLDLIVIDYLQLMTVADPRMNRTQGIGEITRGLKQLARELEVPVVLLSQLSRELEKRTDKRPLMSDLRDSGEIEQDADVILFPYRPAAYCQKCKDRVNDHEHSYHQHQAKAEIIIEKQRAGERNLSIPVCWVGQYQKFVGV